MNGLAFARSARVATYVCVLQSHIRWMGRCVRIPSLTTPSTTKNPGKASSVTEHVQEANVDLGLFGKLQSHGQEKETYAKCNFLLIKNKL